MPFGLANAPETCFIQHVLWEYLDVFCFVHIEDILIFSKQRDQNLVDLRNILRKLQEYYLKALLRKCEFFAAQVTFLGFKITQEGLQMNEQKLRMIQD